MPNYHRYFIENSMIFITIVTYNRKPILIENIDLLKHSIKSAKYKFKIIAGVVLPDHLHIIISPENINEYPKIISSIKYTFSRNINCNIEKTLSQAKRREKGIWQRRYYDHIIRNEEDFQKHLDYIHFNPVKHNFVLKAKDWKHSSFNKFVKNGNYEENWCNFEDNNNILSMELE